MWLEGEWNRLDWHRPLPVFFSSFLLRPVVSCDDGCGGSARDVCAIDNEDGASEDGSVLW